MFKKLWEKFLAWWNASKVKPIFDKIGKAVRQFLRYAYAAQISYLVLSVLFYFLVSKFLGVVLTAWGVVLLVAEIRQQKADKITINHQPEPPKPEVTVESAKPVKAARLTAKKTKK